MGVWWPNRIRPGVPGRCPPPNKRLVLTDDLPRPLGSVQSPQHRRKAVVLPI